jgi:hypothetical protein
VGVWSFSLKEDGQQRPRRQDHFVSQWFRKSHVNDFVTRELENYGQRVRPSNACGLEPLDILAYGLLARCVILIIGLVRTTNGRWLGFVNLLFVCLLIN